MDGRKIREQNRRAVEGWIRGYEAAKETLAELVEEAAEWGMVRAADGMPHARGASDPTGGRAVHMETLPEIAMTRRVLRAVERVYERSATLGRQVMELYFWRDKHYLEVCSRLNIEKSTLYKYAREITAEVAAALGILV